MFLGPLIFRAVYRSYIASKGPKSTADGQVGDLLDSFTIVKRPGGGKTVFEGERQGQGSK